MGHTKQQTLGSPKSESRMLTKHCGDTEHGTHQTADLGKPKKVKRLPVHVGKQNNTRNAHVASK